MYAMTILFIKHDEGKASSLILYVDDMVQTGNDSNEMDRLQKFLASKFEMKALRQLRYYLGLNYQGQQREFSFLRENMY